MQNISEPIICAVNIVRHPDDSVKYLINDKNPFKGEIVIPENNVMNLKGALYDSISFKKIQLPYRFTLISFEVIYKDKHIESVHLSGVYLSAINIPSGIPQLTVWKTLDPPITSVDDNGSLIFNPYSKKSLGNTFFIAHWSEKNAYVHWSLKDNAEILTNPEKYPHRKWIKIEF